MARSHEFIDIDPPIVVARQSRVTTNFRPQRGQLRISEAIIVHEDNFSPSFEYVAVALRFTTTTQHAPQSPEAHYRVSDGGVTVLARPGNGVWGTLLNMQVTRLGNPYDGIDFDEDAQGETGNWYIIEHASPTGFEDARFRRISQNHSANRILLPFVIDSQNDAKLLYRKDSNVDRIILDINSV